MTVIEIISVKGVDNVSNFYNFDRNTWLEEFDAITRLQLIIHLGICSDMNIKEICVNKQDWDEIKKDDLFVEKDKSSGIFAGIKVRTNFEDREEYGKGIGDMRAVLRDKCYKKVKGDKNESQ